MARAYPPPDLPGWYLFDSLLPDFVLGFSFFTALTYAVFARRLRYRRAAAVVAASIGLALSVGLVSWEYATGWSVRDLGPLAVGFALILLAAVMYQAIRGVGGSWAGAGIALGGSLFIGQLLGAWPIEAAIVQTVVVVALLVGILAFVGHRHGRRWYGQHPDAERAIVRHDMSDLEENRRVGSQIWDGLSRLRRQVDQLERRPEDSALVMAQLERLLPAEGWLTDRLARLRTTAHLLRRGHLARIDQLRKQAAKLSPTQRSQARQEIVSRYEELKIDVRLERLDRTVAGTEKRIRNLTRQARRDLAAHEYAKVPNLLDEAVKLQGHNARLITLIERTEARLLALARRAAKQSGEVSDE